MNYIFLLLSICLFSFFSFADERFPNDKYPALDLAQDLVTISSSSDDPFQYPNKFAAQKISISEFSWITKKELPPEIKLLKSKNNVSISVLENRIFMAFRTSKTHFAGKKTRLYVISSIDGDHWDFELEIFEKTDLREPLLSVIDGKLHFYFFKGGSNPFKFEPSHIQKLTRISMGKWTNPIEVLNKGEVPWEIKTRQGKNYLTSYMGTHYQVSGVSDVKVHFQKTLDGVTFSPAQDTLLSPIVYSGGVSEVGWEFDHEGNLWAVGRNEDGDANGFGSQIFFASKDKLNEWKQIGKTDPNNYMSPKMFRVGSELYLIGRKQLGARPFDRTNPSANMSWRRLNNWFRFSISPKGTALYRINKTTEKIDFVMDLPGHGDTAFPSIHRLNEREFLVANYSSPLNKPGRSWIFGQLGQTEIYMMKLRFSPASEL